MLDLTPIAHRQLTLAEFAKRETVTRSDLIDLTNDMIDLQMQLIEGVEDGDVTFVPVDPEAEDPYAASADEANMAWTLGHVIVHVTASSEECCAQAATLARGVEVKGRDRYEIPWEQVHTLGDLRQRLEESRRIRLAYLDAWPAAPHFERTYMPYKTPHNCITRVLAGLVHDHSHLDQIREIVRQARAGRS